MGQYQVGCKFLPAVLKRSRYRLAMVAVIVSGAAVIAISLPGSNRPTHALPTATSNTGRSSIPQDTLSVASSLASTTSTMPPPPATTVPAGPIRGLPVTSTQVAMEDTSRPLVRSGVQLAAGRSLPTIVWRPKTVGRWPLVIFVHGYDVGPMTYARFCAQLASSGYVVAAPSFPLEDPSRGYGLDRNDLPNEATDVSFVITTLLSGNLAPIIESTRIAVVGHSDGADVALMVGYQTGKVDSRVKAIVSDAPDPMTGSISTSSVPLLLIQGNADNIVPYSSSQTVFRQVSAPRYYLTLLGAGHLPPIAGGTPWTPVLDDAVAEFLDSEVAGRHPVADLSSELGQLPLSMLQVAG